jgi:hypothetical protein
VDKLLDVVGVKTGDRVVVEWPSRRGSTWEGFAPRGTVVQVTQRLIVLRAPAGYHFSVSRADLASGVRLKKVAGAG